MRNSDSRKLSNNSNSTKAKKPSSSLSSSSRPTRQGGPGSRSRSRSSDSLGSDRDHSGSLPLRRPNAIPPELISHNITAENFLDVLPAEYRHARSLTSTVDPLLYYLPKQAAATTQTKFPNFRILLGAAEDDIRLHRARKEAAIHNDLSLLRKYQLETDPQWLARQHRLNERTILLQKLASEGPRIVQDLQTPPTGLTAQETSQVQLARWQRALELYVYSPSTKDALGMLELLEQLSEGVAEEDKLSQVLAQAAGMCDTLVNVTQQMVQDVTHELIATEDAYQIRLEAHELFARFALQRQEEIQNQFRINGRAALQIGNQLEFAEGKRQRCESTSFLIRRWWLLESLAEQEALSGEPLKVHEEVRGVVSQNSCRMDPLFTKPENSLEASRALRQLRQVVRSRGNAASADTAADATSSRRFDLTASLIQRTSQALEERLLNTFSELYTKGGTYDFTHKPNKKGVLPWQTLRDLAHACLLFDTGRKLHQRYVDMVVTTQFPELYDKSQIKQRTTMDNNTNSSHNTSIGEMSSNGLDLSNDTKDEPQDETVDSTRTQLSSLFHRVSEVCMQEFQLIAYVFDAPPEEVSGTESIPLTVARMLCTRVIGDPHHGLQARIHGLLDNVDQKSSDFDAGAKKLDTFVVIHEKAAGLFSLLRDAAERLLRDSEHKDTPAARNAVDSLKSFLLSQEVTLNSVHRLGYLNLELRLLHHKCCGALDQAGCVLVRPAPVKVDHSLLEKGILQEYVAPLVPLDKDALKRSGFNDILSGPLKQSVLRQPLIDATDSLARASLMFGKGREGGEGAARVMVTIYKQMCNFYGHALLYPIMEALQEMLKTNPPSSAPQLPFDEDSPAHDLGVDSAMWVGLERIHSAAKSFDRELWAENKKDSNRVWELLMMSGDSTGVNNARSTARECRVDFFTELEQRGEDTIFRALDTLSAHIQWILVTGSEAMLGGAKSLFGMAGSASTTGGPYSMSSGASLEAPNSPAVKSLCYCLRVQFVHVQAALTPPSLSAFWTALSMRVYDILVARLLQNWLVSTVGAVILARDVEALRSVSMLAGTQHQHWDLLRELLTVYMTPPDALKIMLVGPEGDGRGLFARAGKDQSLVFMSRRVDYRYKTNQGQRKSGWVTQLLDDLKVRDPTDFQVNIGKFAAARLFTGKS